MLKKRNPHAIKRRQQAWIERHRQTAVVPDDSLPHDLYAIADAAAVSRFIAQYPFLRTLLNEIPAHIRAYFPNEPLELSLYIDPDHIEKYLLVSIMTELTVEEAWAQFEPFRQTWWLDNIQRGDFKLHIDLGYL